MGIDHMDFITKNKAELASLFVIIASIVIIFVSAGPYMQY